MTNSYFGWHYLIFLLPLGASALLLALSSVRGSGRHGSHSHHAASGARAETHHPTTHHGVKAARGTHKTNSTGKATGASVLAALTGIGRAPLPVVAAAFCLCWGLIGFFANQALLHTDSPTLAQMLPSLGIALCGGIVGGRISSEILGRLLPEEHTTALSRDALYGLTGRVVFTVSETAGRVRIYDEHRTLHDEPCRIASGHSVVEKGREVLIVDRDAAGNLVVEAI